MDSCPNAVAGSEFIAKLAEVYVKNTSAALSALSAKLTGAAEDGKVSLAQAKEAFETLEVGNGPEPLVGVCGGEGARSRLALLYRYIGLRYLSVRLHLLT